MQVFKSLDNATLVSLLKNGAVGFIPTDTVYGIVAAANIEAAVANLYSLKNRVSNPGPIIASSIDQLVDIGIKRSYLNAVKQFWPNPISIEIPHNINYLNQGTGRQAFRIIKGDEDLIKLLEAVGPLVTSSANLPYQPPANNLDEGEKYFGESLDFYVGGGDLSDRKPSTLIRIIDDSIEVIREGAVKVSESGVVSY